MVWTEESGEKIEIARTLYFSLTKNFFNGLKKGDHDFSLRLTSKAPPRFRVEMYDQDRKRREFEEKIIIEAA